MGENVGSDVESEFGSVTSSQLSFLNKCPFADPHSHHRTKSSHGVEDTDSNSTEVLETLISTPVTRTPILSLSTPISLDSINDEDVFRTPPENASLSSAAESEPKARVSEINPRQGGSKLKSPGTTTPVSASASLRVKNVRVLETNRVTDSDEPVGDVTPLTSPPPSFAAGNGKVTGGASKLKSASPVSASSQPLPAETFRVLEVNRVSDPKEPVTEVTPLSSPSSLAAGNVRVTGKQPDLDSSPKSATEGIEVAESGDDDEIEIPFKEVIKALLRNNNGENLDERVSYVDILKQCGLKFAP